MSHVCRMCVGVFVCPLTCECVCVDCNASWFPYPLCTAKDTVLNPMFFFCNIIWRWKLRHLLQVLFHFEKKRSSILLYFYALKWNVHNTKKQHVGSYYFWVCVCMEQSGCYACAHHVSMTSWNHQLFWNSFKFNDIFRCHVIACQKTIWNCVYRSRATISSFNRFLYHLLCSKLFIDSFVFTQFIMYAPPPTIAERKQSLGYDWHPECLRCEECGKRLNPGQHAEHKGIPYCHVPCYGALFGPQLFGHGTRVESHKSFGAKGSTPKIANNHQMPFPRDHIESKLKQYNQYFDNRSHEIRSREVNGRIILEGALRVYWGVQNMIHLKEDDDQRTVVTVRKRNSCRYSNSTDFSSEKSVSRPRFESFFSVFRNCINLTLYCS